MIAIVEIHAWNNSKKMVVIRLEYKDLAVVRPLLVLVCFTAKFKGEVTTK